MTVWTQRPITGAEAAILQHPDQRTPWAPSIAVQLQQGALPMAQAADRLAVLARSYPILDARLAPGRGHWIAGSGRLVVEPLTDELAVLRSRFDVAAGPPLRVAVSPAGDRLVVVSHHAALDGRALVMVARGVLGATPIEALDARELPGSPRTARAPQLPSQGQGGADALQRMVRPADPVAPSTHEVAEEAFVAADPMPGARLRVAALASAAVDAAGEWNAARGAAWRRIGLTVPVGGPAELGNVSTHRRLDLPFPADVEAAVQAALLAAVAPPDAAITPGRARALRVLGPVVNRLSDSLLVSNLGVVDLPGALSVDFFPQARGRSAVAIGACTPRGGAPRLTVRARDLTAADAAALLALVVARLRPASG